MYIRHSDDVQSSKSVIYTIQKAVGVLLIDSDNMLKNI